MIMIKSHDALEASIILGPGVLDCFLPLLTPIHCMLGSSLFVDLPHCYLIFFLPCTFLAGLFRWSGVAGCHMHYWASLPHVFLLCTSCASFCEFCTPTNPISIVYWIMAFIKWSSYLDDKSFSLFSLHTHTHTRTHKFFVTRHILALHGYQQRIPWYPYPSP